MSCKGRSHRESGLLLPSRQVLREKRVLRGGCSWCCLQHIQFNRRGVSLGMSDRVERNMDAEGSIPNFDARLVKRPLQQPDQVLEASMVAPFKREQEFQS